MAVNLPVDESLVETARRAGRHRTNSQAVKAALEEYVRPSPQSAAPVILIDTSVWSLALRRKPAKLNAQQRLVVDEWAELVRDGQAQIIGPIRQEILSGVRDERQLAQLEQYLAAFPDLPVTGADHVLAARFFNSCRNHGLTGGVIDLLICAVAFRNRCPILSVDQDFERYARILPIQLHHPEAG